MGRIQRNLYYNTEFLNVSYDDVDVLMGLIVYRTKLDSVYQDRESLVEDRPYIYSENTRCIYMDIDNMIEKTNLSKKQKYVIENLFRGLSLQDIANLFNANKRDILSILRSACKKIQAINHIDTVDWLEHTGRVKVSGKNRYKRCIKCGRDLPEKYFSPNSKMADGYLNVCKICRS